MFAVRRDGVIALANPGSIGGTVRSMATRALQSFRRSVAVQRSWGDLYILIPHVYQ